MIYSKLEKQKILTILNYKHIWKNGKISLLAAFLIALAQLSFWLSFGGTIASLTSPITSTDAGFTVLFAIILLLEKKFQKKNRIAALIILISIFGLSLA